MKLRKLLPILLSSNPLNMIPDAGYNPDPYEYERDMKEILEEEGLSKQCIMSIALYDEEATILHRKKEVNHTIEFKTDESSYKFFLRVNNDPYIRYTAVYPEIGKKSRALEWLDKDPNIEIKVV